MVHFPAENTQPGSAETVAQRLANGPDLWSAILATMPPGSIVAGGAVRDFLLGVEPKDIDVFCPTEALGAFDFTGFVPLGEDRREEYEALSFIDIVQRTTRHGYQVDLVGVYLPGWSPLALVETFDFGITRSWFGADGLHDTAEAGYDRSCNVVTLLVPGRPERAAVRFARFNERHGGRFTYSDEVARALPAAAGPMGEGA